MTPRSCARTPKCKGRTWAHEIPARRPRCQGALPHVHLAAVVSRRLMAVRPEGLRRAAGPDHRAAAELDRPDCLAGLAREGRLPLEGPGGDPKARAAANGGRGAREARHVVGRVLGAAAPRPY